MKKVFFVIWISILTVSCTSCINRYNIPIGTDATKDFIVDNHIVDNAIYQSSSTLQVTGQAESGVVIIIKLLDSRGSKIEQGYSMTDNKGNWNIIINTPKISDKNYTLNISDSQEKFKKEYKNIRFGEVWLVTGDEVKTPSFGEDQDVIKEFDSNKMFCIDGKWQKASSNVSMFGSELIQSISENNRGLAKNPIAIVFATSPQISNAYAWLSKDIIDSRTSIKKNLENKQLYKEDLSDLKENEMSYFYETKLKNIEKLSFNKIIWNQGLKDFLDIQDNAGRFEFEYSQLLYTLFTEFERMFPSNSGVMVLQESSNFIKKTEKLRKAQSNVCDYFAKCKVVTTYDLNIVVEKISNTVITHEEVSNYAQDSLEINGLDLELLANRIVALTNEGNKVATIHNVLQVYNDEKQITSIKLIFDHTVRFDRTNNEITNGLEFTNEKGELIELKYEFIDNQIVIYLTEVMEKIDEMQEESIVMIHQISKIAYAQNDFIYDNNIYAFGIAIDPFEFKLQK